MYPTCPTYPEAGRLVEVGAGIRARRVHGARCGRVDMVDWWSPWAWMLTMGSFMPWVRQAFSMCPTCPTYPEAGRLVEVRGGHEGHIGYVGHVENGAVGLIERHPGHIGYVGYIENAGLYEVRGGGAGQGCARNTGRPDERPPRGASVLRWRLCASALANVSTQARDAQPDGQHRQRLGDDGVEARTGGIDGRSTLRAVVPNLNVVDQAGE